MQSQGVAPATEESSEIGALDKLENRVVEIVEQLRSARELQREAELETARLRDLLEEKEREAAQLKALTSGGDSHRSEVRKRIEALLERVEALE